MTERTERIIDIADLAAAVIRCDKCGTSFQVLPTPEHSQGFGLDDSDPEPRDKRCPICGEPVAKTTRVVFRALCDLIYYSGFARGQLRLRLADPATAPPASDTAPRPSPRA